MAQSHKPIIEVSATLLTLLGSESQNRMPALCLPQCHWEPAAQVCPTCHLLLILRVWVVGLPPDPAAQQRQGWQARPPGEPAGRPSGAYAEQSPPEQ